MTDAIDTRNTILVVDDDPYMFNLLSDFLHEAGYKVLRATQAEKVFEVTGQTLPNIILLDINLPGADGFSIAAQLKANKETRDIPVIFMSVRSDSRDKVRAFELGAVDYLTKPINLDEAAARIDTHLTICSLQKSLEEKNARLIQEIADRKKVEEALRKSEEKIKASLREKEVLLKEIHHRVKNNLQIINSLLNLQSRDLRDKNSLAIFEKCKHRIDSIALVHEKLYQSENLANINFKEYMDTLATRLFNAYSARIPSVALRIEAANVFLDVGKAIPCALIINELLTNAIKHAFPIDKEGEIRLELNVFPGGKAVLVASDNGVGLPASIDNKNPGTLGLQIVNALVGQLHGRLLIDKSNGTKIIIEFQVGNYNEKEPKLNEGNPD